METQTETPKTLIWSDLEKPTIFTDLGEDYQEDDKDAIIDFCALEHAEDILTAQLGRLLDHYEVPAIAKQAFSQLVYVYSLKHINPATYHPGGPQVYHAELALTFRDTCLMVLDINNLLTVKDEQ